MLRKKESVRVATVQLTERQVKFLFAIGNGFISKGIRSLVEKEMNKKKSAKK